MNTAFVDRSNIYTFDKAGVDPDSIIKSNKFDNRFKIELYFEDVCKSCKSTNPIDRLCANCQNEMKSEVKEWKKIQEIIELHQFQMKVNSESLGGRKKVKEWFNFVANTEEQGLKLYKNLIKNKT